MLFESYATLCKTIMQQHQQLQSFVTKQNAEKHKL